MPPRGVKSAKRERQYEHIKDSAKKRGRSTRRAKQIAAATVNKQRREAGETKTSRKRKTSGSKTSTKSSSSRKSSGSRKSSARKTSSRKKTSSSSSKKR